MIDNDPESDLTAGNPGMDVFTMYAVDAGVEAIALMAGRIASKSASRTADFSGSFSIVVSATERLQTT